MKGVIERISGDFIVIEGFKEKLTDVVELLTASEVTFIFSKNYIYVPLNW